MDAATSSSSVAPNAPEDQTLAIFIVVCSLVQGADIAMFIGIMKAFEEYFSVSPESLAFVLLAQGLAHAVAAPLWGILADRHDRIKLAYMNMLAISVLTFLTGVSVSFPMLCAARVFTGVFSAGLGPIIQTMLASAVEPDERGKFFSYLVVAGQLGGSLGSIYGASFSHQETLNHQGWRFSFISMSLATLLVAALMFIMYEYLSKMLSRALVTSNHEPWDLQQSATDSRAILSRRSFLLLLCQGAFASTAHSCGSFLIEIFQYAGFEDFEASTLVGWISIGQIVGALSTGFWADECARRDPAKGRILYGVAGNCCVIAILLGLAIGGLDNILNVRHYIQLGAICFFTGVFQLWAYVGAVKPILSEIVPRRLTGQTLAYAAGIDGAIASILGAPVLAAIAQELFHYQPTELMINDMSRTLRINNLLALSNAYFTVVLVSMVAATILFAALVQTYQYDKEASLKEDNENEQSTLIDQQSTPDKQI